MRDSVNMSPARLLADLNTWEQQNVCTTASNKNNKNKNNKK